MTAEPTEADSIEPHKPLRQGRRWSRFTKPARRSADLRPHNLEPWREHADPNVSIRRRFQLQWMLVLGGAAIACIPLSLLDLVMGYAPGGWQLALRPLSVALAAVAFACCVLAVRHRYPRRGYLRYTAFAVAALAAGAVALGISIS